MKILLINPPLTVESVYGKYSDLASFQPPIGLCSLAAYLRANSYKDVRILDASVLLMSIEKVVNEVLAESPDMVGIYTNTVNFYKVVALVEAIKGSNLKARIVLGGPHPSCLPKSTLENSKADYCVAGEGEKTLLELLQFLERGEGEPDFIDGLVYRNSSQEIIENKPRERIQDLDSLPFPAIDLLPSVHRYKLYLSSSAASSRFYPGNE